MLQRELPPMAIRDQADQSQELMRRREQVLLVFYMLEYGS